MTPERLFAGMLSGMIVQLALGLKALGAHVTDILAVGGVELGMPPKQILFLETAVAPRDVARIWFCGPRGEQCRGRQIKFLHFPTANGLW